MAVSLYTGANGAGKTYEVVTEVVVSAIRPQRKGVGASERWIRGQRIVTNISGMNRDAIIDHAIRRFKIPSEAHDLFGEIVNVSHDRVLEPDFCPYRITQRQDPDGRLVECADDSETLVKGGDLVVIDECWKYWPSGSSDLQDQHFGFFRLHRQFTDENGVSSNVVLLTQAPKDLIRKVNGIVTYIFAMQKLTALGMANRYLIEVYRGNTVNKDALLRQERKSYDPRLFHLYSSFAGGRDGEIRQVDSRINIWKNPRLWMLAAFVLCCLTVGPYVAWRSVFASKEPVASESVTVSSSAPVAAPLALPESRPAPVSAAEVSRETISSVSSALPLGMGRSSETLSEASKWKIVGTSKSAAGTLVVLLNGSSVRRESASLCDMVDGSPVRCRLSDGLSFPY